MAILLDGTGAGAKGSTMPLLLEGAGCGCGGEGAPVAGVNRRNLN